MDILYLLVTAARGVVYLTLSLGRQEAAVGDTAVKSR
jgi:hypothetical protein